MRTLALLLILFFFLKCAVAQNVNYAREIIDKLCSSQMHGRGYVKKGDSLAAQYIVSEFKKWNLESFNENYLQFFNTPVNSLRPTCLRQSAVRHRALS